LCDTQIQPLVQNVPLLTHFGTTFLETMLRPTFSATLYTRR